MEQIKCNCGNHIASRMNDCVLMRHRGRTLRIYGKVVIKCEACGRKTEVEPVLCGLGGNNSFVPTGKGRHAESDGGDGEPVLCTYRRAAGKGTGRKGQNPSGGAHKRRAE